MPQRDYVCMYDECMFKFMKFSTQTLQRENVCMYVITYVYDFTEMNATMHYYVFRNFRGKWFMISFFYVTVKLQ